MKRGPREREARYLYFTIQRPGDLIYIPHLLAHAVLTLDTGSRTILSGWDATTTSNQRVVLQTLDEYTFGVRRGKWRENLRKRGLSALREWMFSPSNGPQESKEKLQNTGIIGSSILPFYYHPYTLNKRFPVKVKVIASPLCSHLSSAPRVKTLLVQGLLLKY